MKLSQEERDKRAEDRKLQKYNETHKEIDNIIYKLCSFHNHWLPMNEENFSVIKGNDGYHTYCRRCNSEKSKKWSRENPERSKQNDKNKYNENKPEWRVLHHRNYSKKQRDEGYQSEYRRKNPDKIKVYNENARVHDISENEWNACLKIFNHMCAYCGCTQSEAKLKYKQYLHKEHVDHNGYNDLRNAVPSCRICNVNKWQFPVGEWYSMQEFFSQEKLDFVFWWTSEGYKEYIEYKMPYRVIKKKNIDNNKFHFELWTVDEKRNLVECISKKDKKNDLDDDIKYIMKE